jgi:transposase-like protein
MRYFCPNPECKEHDNPSENYYIKKGYFKTKHNHQPVPRYQCKTCGTKFSSHTFRDTLNQKKPYLNEEIFKLYSSGMTLRRLAKVLKCHQQTVANKLIFLGSKALKIHNDRIDNGELKTSYVQFDETETFEITKLQPVSIALAVRPKTGEIIDVGVATMKAKGHLADLAWLKGIERDDTRDDARRSVMATVARCAKDRITVAADALACYPKIIKAAMPQADIKQIPAGRKDPDGRFDSLFGINHTCALLRHDLSRLRRKTWVTTKRLDRLFLHLYLYIAYHNKYSKQMFSYR